MRFNLLLFFCISTFTMHSQNEVNFGVKGGLNLTFFNVEEANFGANTETETGFYLGAFTEFEINKTFSLQPEVLYIGLSDFKFINAPIYAKYEVANNFNLLAGPSLNYFFDFFSSKFKVRADISASYNITPSLDAHMKYTIGFEEIAPNGLFIGMGLVL